MTFHLLAKKAALKSTLIKKAALKSSALKSSALKSSALKSSALKSSALKSSALKSSALKSSALKNSALKSATANIMGDFNPDNSTFMPTQPGPFAFIGPPGACMLGDSGGFGVAANCKWGAEITHGPSGTTVSGKLTCNA